MEEVTELLRMSYSATSTEEVQQVTQALLQLHQNPDAIGIFLQIFSSPNNRTIKQSAVINLGKTLKNTWKSVFCGNENGENLKKSIIEIFTNETDNILTFTLVHAIDTILKTDAANWAEYFNLIFQLSQGDTTHLALSLYLAQYYIPKLNPEQIDVDAFSQLAANALQSTDHDIIVHACGLASVIIYYTNLTESKSVQLLFDLMMNAFQTSLSDANLAARISARLAFCFKTEDFHIPAPELLDSLLNLFNIEGLDPKLYGPIYTLIEELIARFGKSLREKVPQILQHTILTASQLFLDDKLYEYQEDMIFILGTIETASTTIRSRSFFNELFQAVQVHEEEENPSLFASKIVALYNCIEHSSEAVMKNIDDICEYLVQRLNYDNFCVQEVSVMAMEEIGKLLQEGQDSIGNNILRPLISMICQDDIDITNPDVVSILDHSFDAIAKILSTINIESMDDATVLLQRIKLFIDNDVSPSKCINVLSNLVFSIGSQVTRFSEDLFSLMSDWVNLAENDDTNLKQNVIEALGNMLRFCENTPEEQIRVSLEYIIGSYETDDLEIRSAIIVAIENMILIKSQIIMDYKEQIIAIVEHAMNLYITTAPEDGNDEDENADDIDDEEEDFEESREQLQIRYIHDAVLMVRMIYKYYPELAPENDEEWMNMILNMMGSGSEDIQVAAAQAASYLSIRKAAQGVELNAFYEAAIKNLEESNFVQASSFKYFACLFENNVIPDESVISEVLKQATITLKKDLDDDDGTFLDNSARLYRFLASVATMFPQMFPLNEFLDHGNKLMKEDSNFEKSQYLGVLRQLYNSTELPDIPKKFVVKQFMNIDICDFSVIPEPILGIMAITEKEPQIVYKHLEGIIERLIDILQSDETSEMHYFSTIADAMSLLCTFMKKFPDDIPWEDCMACITAHLPVRGDDIEAENVYSTLVALVNERPEFESFKQGLFEGFKAALENQELIQQYKLSESTLQAITNYVSKGPYE